MAFEDFGYEVTTERALVVGFQTSAGHCSVFGVGQAL
jgi:hypothetical protein